MKTDYHHLMTRRAFALSIPPLLLPARLMSAPELDISEFFEKFTADWLRADPQLATRNQFFSAAEQDKLDGQLTPQTPEFRKQRAAQARRWLEELRRFDRSRL